MRGYSGGAITGRDRPVHRSSEPEAPHAEAGVVLLRRRVLVSWRERKHEASIAASAANATAEAAPAPPAPRNIFAALGPGLVTGAADDDPSGIATYSQVGAQFGYGLTWVMLFSYPLMAVTQAISARIGCVTGRGIAQNLRRHYPRSLPRGVVLLLLLANVANLGADLGAMGSALQLLIGGPTPLYTASSAALCVLLEVFLRYARYAAVLKWLTLSLFSYVAVVFAVDVPWGRCAPALSCQRSCSTALTQRRWWPCLARRSVPTCSSGRHRRKSRSSSAGP